MRAGCGRQGQCNLLCLQCRPHAAAQAQNATVLPQVDKVRVERSGNQRWLVVDGFA
jgi:uncharacterized lipoprotein